MHMQSDVSVDVTQIRRVAQDGLGFDSLRPGQQAVIRSVLDGHDTLAVMPTGSGKSAIYEIAGELLPGATVVVSPLIALQRDQAAAIAEQEVGSAAVINSTLAEGKRQAAFDELQEQKIEFVFLAPEQFSNPEVLEKLLDSQVSLFVVDEAHCISEWGHDFRPDYLRLGTVIEALGHPTVLALTATAAPPVRREIVTRLGMRGARTVVRGFDRPNIWLGVQTFADEVAKRRALVKSVSEAAQAGKVPGIVYAGTRKHAEEVAEALRDAGVKAERYHAGLRAKERARIQRAFMDDEFDVIVATIAFGMGVDKPDVRFVFHYDISDSLDAYYQEIGRAGRDAEPAQAVLFYCPEDLGLRRFFASSGKLDPEQVKEVVEAVDDAAADDVPVAPEALRAETELSKTKLASALDRLEELGALEKLPSGEVLPGDASLDDDQLAALAVQAQEQRREYEMSRLEMMRGYAEAIDCRRRQMLSYFGEELAEPCGYCDNCDAGTVASVGDDRPFAVNSRVVHSKWGEGQVLRYEADTIVVLFDQVGYKNLALSIVTEDGLLRTVE